MPGSTIPCSRLNIRAIRPSADPEAHAIHRAALEWSLTDPIIIRSAEEIKSRVDWRDRFQPFEHQVQNLITFCRRLPVMLIADEVGLGKTISAGLILAELMARRRVQRALVVAPKVLGPQWVEELATKFGIAAVCPPTSTEFTAALRGAVPVIVTTYTTFSNRIDRVRDAGFDLLVLDEAHKLRNLHGPKPPKLAVNLRKALAEKWFENALLLTATPIMNSTLDLYSLVDLLTAAQGQPNPLGDLAYFKGHWMEDKRRIRSHLQADFQGVLRRYIARTRRDDARLVFPSREVRLERRPPTRSEKILESLTADCFPHISGLEQISISQALFSSPAALAKQLENKGNPDLQELAEAAREVANSGTPTAKMLALSDLLTSLREASPSHWRAVVFTTRLETQNAIARYLERENITYGLIRGAKAADNQRTIERFRQDPPAIHVVLSTDAGAEGVNLQSGNVVVNFDLPWNPMVLEQRIGRVQRLGSKFERVVVVNLAVRGSVEERVVVRLVEKLQAVTESVGDIESLLESANLEGDEGAGSFQDMLRQLVVKAFAEQDVEQAVKVQQENITRAKVVMQEHAEEVHSVLGDLTELHRSGAAVPDIQRTRPGLDAAEFVRQALLHDGHVLQETTDLDLWEASPPLEGNRRHVAFSDRAWEAHAKHGVFAGLAPARFVPGKPDFERLVQKWVDKAGGLSEVSDDCVNEGMPEALVELAEQLKVDIRDYASHAESLGAEGLVTIKATIANGVDSYEKLIDIPVPGALIDASQGPLIPLDLSERTGVWKHWAPLLTEVIQQDRELLEFSGFYLDRLNQARAEANGLDGSHRFESDLTPHLWADVVAYKVKRQSGRSLQARLCWPTGETLEVSASRDVFSDDWRGLPEIDRCAHTGQWFPESMLMRCAISGHKARSSCLIRSERSGREAMPEFGVKCESSGRILLTDEVETCAVSGKQVDADLLVSSDVTSRKALEECTLICDYTGRRLLNDEGWTSGATGRLGYRRDFHRCAITDQWVHESEMGRCEVSGKEVLITLLVDSELSHRQALPEFVTICEISGRRLLRDEIDSCEISGSKVGLDLLVTCHATSRKALIVHTVACDFSGERLLKNEARTSDATGRVGYQGDFFQCALSGKWGHRSEGHVMAGRSQWALESELVECDFSGAWLAPQDVAVSELTSKRGPAHQFGVCALTSRRLHESELVNCSETGRRLGSDQVIKSVISGRVIGKDHAVTLASGGVCGRGEAVRCDWLGGYHMSKDIRVCQLTGLKLSQGVVNDACELTILRDALEGRVMIKPLEGSWATEFNQHYKGRLGPMTKVSSVAGIKSTTGYAVVIVAELSQKLSFITGRRVRRLGMVVRRSDPPARLGSAVIGLVTQGMFIKESNLV